MKHHHVLSLVDAILQRTNGENLRKTKSLLPKWYADGPVTEFTYGAHKQRAEDLGERGLDGPRCGRGLDAL